MGNTFCLYLDKCIASSNTLDNIFDYVIKVKQLVSVFLSLLSNNNNNIQIGSWVALFLFCMNCDQGQAVLYCIIESVCTHVLPFFKLACIVFAYPE